MTAATPFVPDGWPLPAPLATERFRLAPLGPEHNASDHHAWGGSIDHIRATPGFAAGDWGSDAWPLPMSAADNLADLEMHAREFAERVAFAYTVLAPERATDQVIGCVYVDPDERGIADAQVRSWVTASHADLDVELSASVRAWLAAEWPFRTVRFPGR